MVEQVEGEAQAIEGGEWAPLPFDKIGNCIAVEGRARIFQAAAPGRGVTDVLVFCHGWNNDRNVASARYEEFIAAFQDLRRVRKLDMGRTFNPLLVGLLWPSTTLVFGDERVPKMAGSPSAVGQEVTELAELVNDEDRGRFQELASRSSLSPEDAAELAGLLPDDLGMVADEAPEETGDGVPLALWQNLPDVDGETDDRTPEEIAKMLEDFGWEDERQADELAEAAGIRISPRALIRLLSVRQMKDRAGVVGASGAARFLEELLDESAARVHLIGHSYGACVVLNALCASRGKRNVESVLLLQPAVSHLCFAQRIPGTEHRAGFADAPGKVNRPIMATYSSHDNPLRRFYHLALRRAGDAGELSMAGSKVPKYGALGGYGPTLLDGVEGDQMRLPDQRYDVTPGRVALIALDGEKTISGHGDVINEATSWALLNLLADVE